MAYTPTNWKDRDVENPRTYTARQNEDGSVTFFDAPGTINEAGTPVNAVNMNKIEEQLYKNDLERKITNCITEIPQDIKLELNNGVLTLKAGSKIYVPNGKDSSGNNVFDEIVIESDLTTTDTGNRILWFSYNFAANKLSAGISSETGAPVSGTYKMYYDPGENKCFVSYASGYGQTSFPICIIKSSTTGITSINQVFNGFGYIGSTVFALPNVKGLIPNGRNADGSLMNIEFTVSKVAVLTFASNVNTPYNGRFLLNSTGGIFARIGSYDAVNNYNLGANGVDILQGCSFAEGCLVEAGVIKTFNSKPTFHAVDDQGVVKTSGDQTIGGVKTFTSDPYAIASQPNYYLQMLDYDNSTTPTAAKVGALTILDKNKNIAGRMGFWTWSDGSKSMRFITFDGQGNNTQLQVGFKSDGSGYTTCPTPESTSNTNAIATTAWVRNYVKNTGGGANWASKVSVARDTNYTAPSNGYIAALMQFDDASGTLTINNAQIFTAGGNVQSPSFTFVPVSKGDVVKLSGGAWVTAYFVPFK